MSEIHCVGDVFSSHQNVEEKMRAKESRQPSTVLLESKRLLPSQMQTIQNDLVEV